MKFSRWAVLPLIVGLSVGSVACGPEQPEVQEEPTEGLGADPVEPGAVEETPVEATEEPLDATEEPEGTEAN